MRSRALGVIGERDVGIRAADSKTWGVASGAAGDYRVIDRRGGVCYAQLLSPARLHANDAIALGGHPHAGVGVGALRAQADLVASSASSGLQIINSAGCVRKLKLPHPAERHIQSIGRRAVQPVLLCAHLY